MLRNIAPILALIISMVTSIVSAQEFDSFRLISENTPAGAGFVTGISLNTDSEAAQISFLNAAGLSRVYDVALTTSDAISENTPVFLPPSGFSDFLPPALDLEGVQFFKGSLIDPDDGALPPHWFRLTKFNGRWSGAFRVADRVYAIDRSDENNIVDVRYTPSTQDIFQPTRRVKVSAVIDDEYLFADGTDNLGHLHALESIHVMDGLLADTLNTTVLLEQLIYQPAAALTSPEQISDVRAGARNWLDTNGAVFGLTDNIATLFFRNAINSSPGIRTQPDNGLIDDGLIVQGNYNSYQFATAHYFGRLLGIFEEPMTLQDLTTNADGALLSAHWSDQQKEFLELNPPSADLIQVLSFDTPVIAAPPPEEINEIDSRFIDAEAPEGANQGPALLNDDDVNVDPGNASGGGSYSLNHLMLILLVLYLSNMKKILHRTNGVISVTRR